MSIFGKTFISLPAFLQLLHWDQFVNLQLHITAKLLCSDWNPLGNLPIFPYLKLFHKLWIAPLTCSIIFTSHYQPHSECTNLDRK